jgi:hypothetical protein
MDTQFPAPEAPRDLYPASDLRFVLLEIGKLDSKLEGLAAGLGRLDHRLGGNHPDPKQTVAFVKGAVWAVGCFVFGIVLGWYLSGKITFSLHPGG